MRRVVSLFLPSWPTDRLRRRKGGPPPDEPLVTVAQEGSRRALASVDARARSLGLRSGFTVAHAQAMVPGLHIVEATPEEDETALTQLTAWCLRYAPLVAPDPPDGIWIDIAGAAHLFGGEAPLIEDLVGRLARNGIAASATVADAPGAAWALARYGEVRIVSPGGLVDAVASLPVEALRLEPKILEALRRLGVDRIGQLAAMPRAPMVRRFGNAAALRLDQAFGHVFEPISPIIPEETPWQRLAFAEPVGSLEDLKRATARLSTKLCRKLEKRSLGVRRLDLILRRTDRRDAALRVSAARATRDAPHLARLFDEQLEAVDPGFGIDEALLVASRIEPLEERQVGVEDGADLGRLVDRLGARLGESRVYRLASIESHVPERSMKRIPALAPPTGVTWPARLPRPSRLLDPPEPVAAMALVPDHPPVSFVWRRVRHRVRQADGPERVLGEWWISDREIAAMRDYYRVETEAGARFWLFRDAPAAEGGRWWLHGLFA
jgi:protein ImuB